MSVDLKLVRTCLNTRILGTSTAAIFFQEVILSINILPRMNGMLDFICMGPVDLQGARRKRQNSKWTILAHNGTRTYSIEIFFLTLYRLSYPGIDETFPIKGTFINTYDNNIFMYNFEDNEVVHISILFCTYTVLCYMLEYI